MGPSIGAYGAPMLQSKIQCPSGSQDYRTVALMSHIRWSWKGRSWISSDPWSDHSWTPFCSPTNTGDPLDRLASPVRVMSCVQGVSSPPAYTSHRKATKTWWQSATVPIIVHLLMVGLISRGGGDGLQGWGAATVFCCSTPPTRRWHNRGNIRPLNIGRDCVEMVLKNSFYPTAVTTLQTGKASNAQYIYKGLV